jgi:hypothetical protein
MPTKEPYRPVFPSEWKDPRLKELRIQDRGLVEIYFYLTTGPATSPIGFYSLNELDTHGGRLGLGNGDLLRGIEGVCDRYGWGFDYDGDTDKGIVLLDGWWQAHPPSSSTVAIGLLKHLDNIPDHPLKLRFLNGLTWIPKQWEATWRRIASLQEGYRRGIGGVSGTPEHTVTVTKTVTEIETNTETEKGANFLEDQPQTAKPPTTPAIQKLIEEPPPNIGEDWLSLVSMFYGEKDGSGAHLQPKYQNTVENHGHHWQNLLETHGTEGVYEAVRVYFRETGRSDYLASRRSFDNCIVDTWNQYGGKVAQALEYLQASDVPSAPENPAPAVPADLRTVWEGIEKLLRDRISEEDFGTWFDRVALIAHPSDRVFVFTVPSNYRRDVLRDTYEEAIIAAIRQVAEMDADEPVEIQYEIANKAKGGADK